MKPGTVWVCVWVCLVDLEGEQQDRGQIRARQYLEDTEKLHQNGLWIPLPKMDMRCINVYIKKQQLPLLLNTFIFSPHVFLPPVGSHSIAHFFWMHRLVAISAQQQHAPSARLRGSRSFKNRCGQTKHRDYSSLCRYRAVKPSCYLIWRCRVWLSNVYARWGSKLVQKRNKICVLTQKLLVF